MTVKEIMKLLGGRSFVATLLNAPEGRINSWCSRDYISDWHRDKLIEIAKKQGKKLTEDDFPKREK